MSTALFSLPSPVMPISYRVLIGLGGGVQRAPSSEEHQAVSERNAATSLCRSRMAVVVLSVPHGISGRKLTRGQA